MESKKITVRNARIIYRNFAGRQTDTNPAGKRNFTLIIDDPDLEAELIRNNYYVKPGKVKDDGTQFNPTLKVSIGFDDRFKHTYKMITSTSTTTLDEDTIGILDAADIEKIDMVIRPYDYSKKFKTSNGTGISAYVETLFVTIHEDELEKEYAKAEQQESDEEFPY